jgi:dipeptidyl aminopeptidase/acylaminoacyl peptidase
LAPVEEPIGLFWLSDERLLVSRSAIGPVIVPAAGGRSEPLGPRFRASSFVHTQALPGATHLLGTTAYGDLGVISLETGGLRFITVGEPAEQARAEFGRALRGSNPRYLTSGHLVYASGSSLMAVSFNPRTFLVTGRPTPILSDVRNEGSAGEAHFAIGDEGTLVYAPGVDGSTGRLVWSDRTGRITDTLPIHPVNVLTFRLSRDGRRLAVVERLPNSPAEVFITDLTRGVQDRARLRGEFAVMAWTADDRQLIGYSLSDTAPARACCFTGSELDAGSLTLRSTDPPAPLRLLSEFDESPDGVLRCGDAFPGVRESNDVGILRRKRDDGSAARIVSALFYGDCGFSPDGRWIAFTNADGLHVTQASLDSTLEVFKLAPRATSQLRWNRNGREIVYRAGRALFAVELQIDGNRVEASSPRRLFQRDGFFRTWDIWGTGWDLAPDGRFVIWQGPTQPPARQLRAVTNVGDLIARTLGTSDAGR